MHHGVVYVPPYVVMMHDDTCADTELGRVDYVESIRSSNALPLSHTARHSHRVIMITVSRARPLPVSAMKTSLAPFGSVCGGDLQRARL